MQYVLQNLGPEAEPNALQRRFVSPKKATKTITLNTILEGEHFYLAVTESP